MTTIVGAEYIIANLLILIGKAYNRNSVSVEEVINAGRYIQKQANENNVDVIFLFSRGQILNAVYSFPEYFEYNKETNKIILSKFKNVSDLKNRFVAYLPFNVLQFLIKTFDVIIWKI